jgi:hypothetical protein
MNISSTMTIETTGSSAALATSYQIARHYIPEDINLEGG